MLFAAAYLQQVLPDAVLAQLESVSGWQTGRIQRPVQILGSLDGILTGVRQLIRKQPLETRIVQWRGHAIAVPTLAEMLRIKAVLILKRNATRDYLDFIAMSEKLGEAASAEALRSLDRLYPQPNRESPLQQLVIQLANPLPYDLEETRLNEYKRLVPQWHDWNVVKRACNRCATSLFDRLAGGKRQTRLLTPEPGVSSLVSTSPRAIERPRRASADDRGQ